MKKSTSFLPFIAVLVSLMAIISCSKSTDSDKSKDIDNMNESIQTTFFGTSFGATKEEVIRNFQEHGLVLKQYISNDNLLHFSPIDGMYISFGNMSWNDLMVGLTNKKFHIIEFQNCSKEKFSAESKYNNILSTLQSKYKLAEEEPSDTLTKVQSGVDDKGHEVLVYLYKGESVAHETWYYSGLQYKDTDKEKPSDEL